MAPKKTLLQEVSHFLAEKNLPPLIFYVNVSLKKNKKKVKKMKKVKKVLGELKIFLYAKST